MIVRSKVLYENTAEKHNLPVDLVESIGNCVFEALVYKLNHPDNLAYELPKIGTWNIRFNMFEPYYKRFQEKLDNNDPEAIKKRDANPELYERTTKMHNKIVEYRKKKEEKRQQRYGKSESNSEEC